FPLRLILQPPLLFFPYTTLFRSGAATFLHRNTADVCVNECLLAPKKQCHFGANKFKNCQPLCLIICSVASAQCIARMCPCAVPVDRKSTRLNSSHVSISYAVFCL